MSEKYITKDSGKRQEFHTGSRRDTQEGKGRFDLLSIFAEKRVAGVCERGAIKYGERNFELGQPISRYYNSAVRHLKQDFIGMDDEDHLAQAVWNGMAMIHTLELIKLGLLPKELDDRPLYLKRKGIHGFAEYIIKINGHLPTDVKKKRRTKK